MNERDIAVAGIKRLGYPGLAKLVGAKAINGKGVLTGIKQLYWKEHTAEEHEDIEQLLTHCEFYEI